MNLNLEGKTTLVTDASRGIGLTIVRKLTEEGAQIVDVTRTVTPELEDANKLAVSVGLSMPGGAEAAVRMALAELGGIGILVNNIGAGDPNVMKLGDFLEIDDVQWHDLFNLNFFNAVWMSCAALPSLLERRDVIINTGSINALVPAQGPVGYDKAKAVLVAPGRRLSEEFELQGVRVNTVFPDGVGTGLWRDPDGFGSRVAASMGMSHSNLPSAMPTAFGIISGRIVEPGKIAAFIVFVALSAAEYLVRANIVIDGETIKTVQFTQITGPVRSG